MQQIESQTQNFKSKWHLFTKKPSIHPNTGAKPLQITF